HPVRALRTRPRARSCLTPARPRGRVPPLASGKDTLLPQQKENPEERTGMCLHISVGKTVKERHTVLMQDPASFSSGTVPADSVFVGRDHPLAFLIADARRALEEGVRAVLVCGEAGVGKTRLIREYLDLTPLGRSAVGGCLELGADGIPF